jgi:hypothetical protein
MSMAKKRAAAAASKNAVKRAAPSTEAKKPAVVKKKAKPESDKQRIARLLRERSIIKESADNAHALRNELMAREQELKSAQANVKAARADLDAAEIELNGICTDYRNGQSHLPFPETTAPTPAADAPVVTDNTAAVPDNWPLSSLGSTAIRGIVGKEVFENQKTIQDPIGLSDKQIEALESACESKTVSGLEKWIAADNWWHDKIKGFGETAIRRVVSTLVAFRAKHPMKTADEPAPTIVESLAEKNDAANNTEPAATVA